MESKWRQQYFELGLWGYGGFYGPYGRGNGLLARKWVGIGAGVYFIGPVTPDNRCAWWILPGEEIVTPVPLPIAPMAARFPWGYTVEPDN